MGQNGTEHSSLQVYPIVLVDLFEDQKGGKHLFKATRIGRKLSKTLTCTRLLSSKQGCMLGFDSPRSKTIPLSSNVSRRGDASEVSSKTSKIGLQKCVRNGQHVCKTRQSTSRSICDRYAKPTPNIRLCSFCGTHGVDFLQGLERSYHYPRNTELQRVARWRRSHY